MSEAMYWKEITVNWGESDPFGLVYYPRIVAWFNDTSTNSCAPSVTRSTR